MTSLVGLRLRLTVNASTAPAASCTRASSTEMPTGPSMLAEVDWLSFRSSLVQMDLLSLQLAASGSVMLIRSLPSGSTVIVQL